MAAFSGNAGVPARLANTPVNAVLQDLMRTPIGQAPGDPRPGMAYNRAPIDDYVRCFVRNWSSNKERRYIFEYVSLLGGGEKTAALKKEKAEPFSIDELRAKIARGQDASILDTAIKSVPVRLMFDGMLFLVEPSKDPKKDPPWVPIPTGLMDLRYGSYERLHGDDSRAASREMEAIHLRYRVDVCVRLDAKGINTNPFGFLEFKREVIEPQAVAVDAEHVFADEFIEV